MHYKKSNIYITLLLIISTTQAAHTQTREDEIWMLGAYGGTLEWYSGLMYYNFSTTPPTATEIEVPGASLRKSRANICDTLGQLLFYTNNCTVQTRHHQLMENGDSLNAGSYAYDHYCDNNGGNALTQSIIILPLPGHPGQYELLHQYMKVVSSTVYIDRLLSSRVDMSQNNGLGKVIEKNKTIASTSSFSKGLFTACRHANGVDWWIPLLVKGTDSLYMFLLDSTGTHLSHIQTNMPGQLFEIGLSGQAVFSPDGRYYARMEALNELDIFHFDRCRGLLYQPVHVDLNSNETEFWECGVAFSPNSRYLYANNSIYLYQFDMEAEDWAASKVLVGEYDGFVDFLSMQFKYQQLGPDGRIYMCAGNEGRFLNVINQPNEAAPNCDFTQHSIELPNITGTSLPNFPNLNLGAASAGYCDSIGLVSPVKPVLPAASFPFNIVPNPARTGESNVMLHQSGQLAVYDMTGRQVHNYTCTAGNTTHLLPLHAGFYTVVFTTQSGRQSAKLWVVD